MGTHSLHGEVLPLPQEGHAPSGQLQSMRRLHGAGDHRQHVLCWLPGCGHGRLQWRQRGSVRGELQRNLVPHWGRQLGRRMCRKGKVRSLHPSGELPELDQRYNGETRPQRHRGLSH
uniref:Uncharacterized protein n=1 Tax=Gasterosteus aculeatus TaxID=69293 RepID=G3NLZ8_GASAC